MRKRPLSINQQRLLRTLLLGHYIAEPDKFFSYYQLRNGRTGKIIGDVNKHTFNALARRDLIVVRQTTFAKKWVAA